MTELVVVTAFFDIGRKAFKAIPRENATYIEHFRFWARLRNHLVVYTDSANAPAVAAVRREFGLLDRTQIIVIDDVFAIEPDLLEGMRRASADPYFLDFRMLPQATSNIPEYSYLMLLKSWFVADAVARGVASGMIAWLDFGFNHGGDVYLDPQEFDFVWAHEFSEKIHLFTCAQSEHRPIFEVVRRLSDFIMGAPFVLPDHMASDFWAMNRRAMAALNSVGLSDDDQLVMLMAYRAQPEKFMLTRSDWFLPLKEFGGEHLTVRSDDVTALRGAAGSVVRGIRKIRRVTQNALRLERNLLLR